MTEPRRDKRGRVIGYNWWREFIMDQYTPAEQHWQRQRESGEPIHTDEVAGAGYDTGYYQLSDAEYRSIHPRPTLRGFLETYAGHFTAPHDREEGAA